MPLRRFQLAVLGNQLELSLNNSNPNSNPERFKDHHVGIDQESAERLLVMTLLGYYLVLLFSALSALTFYSCFKNVALFQKDLLFHCFVFPFSDVELALPNVSPAGCDRKCCLLTTFEVSIERNSTAHNPVITSSLFTSCERCF